MQDPTTAYLDYVNRSLQISDEKRSNILSMVAALKPIICSVVPQVSEFTVFGSFSRSTCLPSILGEKIDIDVLIVLDLNDILSGNIFSAAKTDIQKRFIDLCSDDGNFPTANMPEALASLLLPNNGVFEAYVDQPSVVIEYGVGKVELNFATRSNSEGGYHMTMRKISLESEFPDLIKKYDTSPGIESHTTRSGQEYVQMVYTNPFRFNEVQSWAAQNFNFDPAVPFRLIKYIARHHKIPVPSWYLEVDFYTALSDSSNIPSGATALNLALSFFTDSRWGNEQLLSKFPEFLRLRELIFGYRQAIAQLNAHSALDQLLQLCPPVSDDISLVKPGLLDYMNQADGA